MTLFRRGEFVSSSGASLGWKIECDALTRDDWATLAWLVAQRVSPFCEVHGVPTGGLQLARELQAYVSAEEGSVLIVDDVLTTGASMERARAPFGPAPVMGAVVFARNEPPAWITPLFRLS